jgi:hypothetical protein
MKTVASGARIARDKQSGYALLMALFLVATMIILATVVTPSVLTEGRREREQEAIWRGNQYVRAIQLYYRKNGRYPQTMDDLTKGSLEVHFLRKLYTDPTNKEDGSWRFIYVSPSGQLIGSVRYHSLQEMALKLNMAGAGQSLANPVSAAAAAAAAATGQQGTGAGQQGAGGQGATQQGTGQTDTGAQGSTSNNQQGTTGVTPPSTTGQGSTPAPGASAFGSGFGQPTPAAPLEAVSGPVLGASLIGVAGKTKRPSLIVYQGGKTYFEWEFIWNPLSVISVGGGQPGGLGGLGTQPPVTPPGSTNGLSPIASPTGVGLPPLGATPPTTNPQQ